MYSTNKIGIIADDLTGANDTALQFFLKGCNTKIILNCNESFETDEKTQVWAYPTESRNIDPQKATKKVQEAVDFFVKELGVEYFYKKIDSTLRGNIAQETLTMIEELNYNAAVVLPAFPVEGRITVGGYHLLKGIPIQRTEMACDPHFPICESHIPTILRRQLSDKKKDIVGFVGLDTVMKGAAPVLFAINEQIKQGKKLIVVDSVSIVDIEQVALAINKSNFKILPCGSAGLASILTNIWIDEDNKPQEKIAKLPSLPKLIVSGSATRLVASQIRKLAESIDVDNVYNIAITADDVLNNNISPIVEKALPFLVKGYTVMIHSSEINVKDECFNQFLFENEISVGEFISKIVDCLSLTVKEITAQKEVLLITIGGETSYSVANILNSRQLQVVDALTAAIPLCLDGKNQYLVTKSGNLGNINTLIEILNYFKNHE